MGLHSSGSTIVAYQQVYGDANDMVEALYAVLATPPGNAGWHDGGNLTSECTFFAFNITSGDRAIMDGHIYDFYTPPAVGNVLVGANIDQTLNTWGGVAAGDLQCNYQILHIGGNTYIRFYDIPYPGNNKFLSIFPTGSVGSWDYIVDGTGTGRTWGGGRTVYSANIPGGFALWLKLTTVNTIGEMAITPLDDTVVFDNINVSKGTWKILANKYQFFLFVPLAGNIADTFMYAGHLFRTLGTGYFNYVCLGSRPGFTGLAEKYYCDNGSPFSGVAVGTADKNPTVAVPVYGHGVFSEKFPNPLLGLPVRNDLGEMIPFDAFLAAPFVAGGNVRVAGWFWDALIHSNYLAQDSGSAGINGKTGYVVLSQAGGDAFQQNEPGSLVVQNQT